VACWLSGDALKDYNKRMRSSALAILGDRCVRCGYSDPRALQIDHALGNGAQERRKGWSGSKLYKIVIESVSRGEHRYQLLCANCNWIKKSEDGEVKNGKDVKTIDHAMYKEP